MKKVAVALLVVAAVLIVLAIAGGTLFYFRVYAPMAPIVTLASAASLEDKGLRARDFAPPPSGELTETQVAAFAAVEQEVEDRLGRHFGGIRTAYEQIAPADPTVHRVPARVAIDAFGPVRMPFLLAKRVQIDAMNKAALSKQEYEWVRRRVYQAAGLRLRQVDFTDVLEDLRGGGLRVRAERAVGAIPVPSRNVELTRAVTQHLERWLPLAFWGL